MEVVKTFIHVELLFCVARYHWLLNSEFSFEHKLQVAHLV